MILIGEMRDADTVRAALSAAETGHFVMSHAAHHRREGDREPDHRLLPAARAEAGPAGAWPRRCAASSASGWCPAPTARAGSVAMEIAVNTPRLAEAVADPDRTDTIPDIVADGGYSGMQTFDQHLVRLVLDGSVSVADAKLVSSNTHDFSVMLKRAGVGPGASSTRSRRDRSRAAAGRPRIRMAVERRRTSPSLALAELRDYRQRLRGRGGPGVLLAPARARPARPAGGRVGTTDHPLTAATTWCGCWATPAPGRAGRRWSPCAPPSRCPSCPSSPRCGRPTSTRTTPAQVEDAVARLTRGRGAADRLPARAARADRRGHRGADPRATGENPPRALCRDPGGVSVRPRPSGDTVRALAASAGLVTQAQARRGAARRRPRSAPRRVLEVLARQRLRSDRVDAGAHRRATSRRARLRRAHRLHRRHGARSACCPREFARRAGVLPLGCEDGELVVAVSVRQAGDIELKDDLSRLTRQPDPVRDRQPRRHRGPDQPGLPGRGRAARPDLRPRRRGRAADDLDSFTEVTDEAPVVRFVNLLINQAITDRASDIHIEPTERDVRVRYRIDGVLHDAHRSPQEHPERRDLAAQDHGRHEHRRAPGPPGRPDVGQPPGPAGSTCGSRRCRPCGARRSSPGSSTTATPSSASTTSASATTNFARFRDVLHQALRDDPGRPGRPGRASRRRSTRR